jgi:hypothetical protein
MTAGARAGYKVRRYRDRKENILKLSGAILERMDGEKNSPPTKP